MTGFRDPQRRARRLLRLYPRAWRNRYGEEFEQLLIADIDERPQSRSRTLDLIRRGSFARLAQAGLTSDALDPARQLRAGVVAIGCAFCLFLTFGVGIWSQLTIDWQWSAPPAASTRTGMLMMSAVLAAFVLLLALAAVPLAWIVTRTAIRSRDAKLLAIVAVASLAVAVLIVGSVHIGHRWPGTGGHPWSGRDIVPGPVARFCWAATLWVTSYWAHPAALRSFPASEVEWMIVCPAALLTAFIAGASALRRARPSERVLRYELSLGVALVAAMAVFLAGAGSWVVGGRAAGGLFRVGVIDAVGVTAMSGALSLAFVAAHRSLAAMPIRRP
jgi:hypothetical protein